MAWLKALSLPTLEWAIPFLPLMGLPDLLLKDPKILRTIYTQAITEFNTQRQNKSLALARKGAHGELMREVVTNALQNLAIEMGREVAVDLERWALFHFFCNEAQSAMFQWEIELMPNQQLWGDSATRYHLKKDELCGQIFDDELDLAYAVIDGVKARGDSTRI